MNKFLLSLLLIIIIVFGVTVPIALAQYGLEETRKAAELPQIEGTPTQIAWRIGQFIGYVLEFVGAIFLILMIYGGYLWMTARGNAEQVNKAKDLIINASIGVVIIFAAYAITYFVIDTLTP